MALDDFASSGEAVLVSPVVKKVVAWTADVRLYGEIALHLAASIEL
jgi:pectinesterase